MLGLIGAALAGGAQGAGEAGQRALASMQEAQQKEDLTRLANELDEQKQLRIEGARQKFQTSERVATQTYNTGEREAGQRFTAGENDLNRQATAGLAAQRMMFDAGENDLNRQSTASLAAQRMMFDSGENKANRESNERLAKMQREAQITAANIAAAPKPQLVQQRDGSYMVVSLDGGKTSAVNGPDGKPLIGKKDLDERTTAMVKVLLEEMKDPMLTPDQRAGKSTEIRALLAGEARAPSAISSPTPAAVDALRKNPGRASEFDQLFGAGAAEKVLGGGRTSQPTTAQPMSSEASGAPSTRDPAVARQQEIADIRARLTRDAEQGVSFKGLISGQSLAQQFEQGRTFGARLSNVERSQLQDRLRMLEAQERAR